jgi:alpha-N-arabinofuranosidase
VSASASRDSAGLTHVTLVNIDTKVAQTITVNLPGANFKSVSGRILTGNLQDYNSFEKSDKVKPAVFSGASVSGKTLTVKLPPVSVVVVELK